MSTDDDTPEITNLPMIPAENNHDWRGLYDQLTPRARRSDADFAEWMAAAGRLGYKVVEAAASGELPPNGTTMPGHPDVIWMSPPPLRMWTQIGKQQQRPLRPEALARIHASATHFKNAIWLRGQYQRLDADHMPKTIANGPRVCTICGVSVLPDLIHHGIAI